MNVQRNYIYFLRPLRVMMQPFHELLNEIRWNPGFEPSDYSLGYYDRVLKELGWIEFSDIDFDKSDKFSLYVYTEIGTKHIPFHRFRKVKCKGEVVWERPEKEGESTE